MTTAMAAADNMSAMVILLKSYAPGDMVTSQRGSKSAAADGSTAAASADGPVVTPASVAPIGAAAASTGHEQQGPPAGANYHAHADALRKLVGRGRR